MTHSCQQPHQPTRRLGQRPALWMGLLTWVALTAGCTCGALPPLEESRQIRRATVEGQFYPATARAMKAEVQNLLVASEKLGTTANKPIATTSHQASETSVPLNSADTSNAPIVLAPHAAWFFSGHVAAKAIHALPKDFRRVFILAANHNPKAQFDGISVDRAHAFHLSDMAFEVDQDAVAKLFKHPGFSDVPEAHDTSVIEVELPLLKFASQTKKFTIVPMMVGRVSRSDAKSLAQTLNRVMDRPGDVALFSLDLSHYHPDREARALDQAALDALLAMDGSAIEHTETDGPLLLLILNELAALKNLTPKVLAYANSAQAPEGDPDQVVGYGAVAYEDGFILSNAEKSALLEMVRSSLTAKIQTGKTPTMNPDLMERFPRLRVAKSAFVTLKKNGELRGCMGSILPRKPLAEEVLSMGIEVAVNDARFTPVQSDELNDLHISISVLTPPKEVDLFGKAKWTDQMSDGEKFGDGLRRLAHERPGVLLEVGLSASTFLPSVWDQLPDPVHFLEALCEKQNKDPDCWMKKRAKFQLYTSQTFEESEGNGP